MSPQNEMGASPAKAGARFDQAVNAHEAVHQIEAALSWFDARGRLYCRQTAQPQLDEASQQLQGDCWSKVKRLLSDARTLSHVDRLMEHLPSAVSEPVLRDALTRLSQGLLDLKRLYWNCRVFREGTRKGKSPYDLLGLNWPSSEWWQLLQMVPEELEQKLLIKKLGPEMIPACDAGAGPIAFVAGLPRRNVRRVQLGKRPMAVGSQKDGRFRTKGVLTMELRRKPIKPRKSDVQLMFSTHDPLEDFHRAERAQEDDYFRKHDQELMVTLREKNAEEIEQAIRTYTRMRCPKCGEPLEVMPDPQVTIDACPRCGGIWLDKGEWEGVVGPKEPGWLQRLFAGLIPSTQ